MQVPAFFFVAFWLAVFTQQTQVQTNPTCQQPQCMTSGFLLVQGLCVFCCSTCHTNSSPNPACLLPTLHFCSAGKVSDAMLTLVNKAREEAGAPPLQFSQELEDEAQKRADQLDGKTKTSGSAKLTGTALPRRILKHAGDPRHHSGHTLCGGVICACRLVGVCLVLTVPSCDSMTTHAPAACACTNPAEPCSLCRRCCCCCRQGTERLQHR